MIAGVGVILFGWLWISYFGPEVAAVDDVIKSMIISPKALWFVLVWLRSRTDPTVSAVVGQITQVAPQRHETFAVQILKVFTVWKVPVCGGQRSVMSKTFRISAASSSLHQWMDFKGISRIFRTLDFSRSLSILVGCFGDFLWIFKIYSFLFFFKFSLL